MLTPKSQVSTFLKHAFLEDYFFRNKVIHRLFSTRSKHNNLEIKQDHVSVPGVSAQSQHILLDLSGLSGTSWEQLMEQVAGSTKV